jgi:hypothetical protein
VQRQLTGAYHMSTKILVTRVRPEYSPLVNEAYEKKGECDDGFDLRSYFVAAYLDLTCVGIVRLTSGPNGPLQKWSIGPCPLPDGPNIIQMTRAVVKTNARRRGIYRLMMLRAMTFAFESDYSHAVAVIDPDYRQRQFLFDLGFTEIAAQSMYSWFPNVSGPRRNMVCDLADSHLKWDVVRQSLAVENALEQFV